MRLRSLSAPWFRTALLACGLSLLAAAPAQAQTMTQNFDGLTCQQTAIPNNTGGLTWTNFFCLDGSTYGDATDNGFRPATHSAPNVAFNGFANPAELSRNGGGLFTLNSAYLTAVWNDGLQVRVEAFRSGASVQVLTIAPSATTATLVTFPGMINVDRVVFSSSGGTQHAGYRTGAPNFALDDLNYTLVTAHAIAVAPAPVNGTLSCTPTLVPNGTNATCTATPAPGYQVSTFSGCTRVGTSNDCQLTNVTAPATVAATFALATYAITAANDPNGTLTCTPNPVTHGGNVTCTATPAAGYLLSGFTGCTQVGTGNTCTLSNVTGPATVAALFAVAIPTLSQWALMLLGLGAAGLGARRLRRAA